VLQFSEEENDVVIISMRKSVQGLCCSRPTFSAHSAMKSSTTFCVLKRLDCVSVAANASPLKSYSWIATR
jgi:hypothetical protein